MSTILDEIKPETAETLARLAEASGVSIDDLLNRLISEFGQAPSPRVSPADIDRILDEISEGGERVAPLPPDFSREDHLFRSQLDGILIDTGPLIHLVIKSDPAEAI